MHKQNKDKVHMICDPYKSISIATIVRVILLFTGRLGDLDNALSTSEYWVEEVMSTSDYRVLVMNTNGWTLY